MEKYGESIWISQYGFPQFWEFLSRPPVELAEESEGRGMAGRAKGKGGMYVELPLEELSAFRDFCRERGAKLVEEVRLAIRRHMSNPPVITPLPPLAPLPPVAPPPTNSKKATKRK